MQLGQTSTAYLAAKRYVRGLNITVHSQLKHVDELQDRINSAALSLRSYLRYFLAHACLDTTLYLLEKDCGSELTGQGLKFLGT